MRYMLRSLAAFFIGLLVAFMLIVAVEFFSEMVHPAAPFNGNIPEQVRAMLAGYDLTPVGFLLLVNAILLVLGCVLEGTAILLIVVPVFIPAAQHLGIDLVHFGVMVVVNIMLGMVTPPYGLLLFVMNSVTGVPLNWPYGDNDMPGGRTPEATRKVNGWCPPPAENEYDENWPIKVLGGRFPVCVQHG